MSVPYCVRFRGPYAFEEPCCLSPPKLSVVTYLQVILIDVRKPDHYHQSHILNALNFPCGSVSPPTTEEILGDAELQDAVVSGARTHIDCTPGKGPA